ncbi:hypothetical protein AAVH_30028 [Aphelenchoides avenae]|nr:hypothetical protein AAVH_30028 [Aphelenchus avenae]
MANPPVATSDEKDEKPKQTVKERRVGISATAQFLPKKRIRSAVKLEKLMRKTTERTETVALDSDSDADSCNDSNCTTTTPAASPANTATSAAESQAVPEQPSEPLSAGATAIVGQYIEGQCSAAAPSASVGKEQQPCSSSSLGLLISAATAGRPLAEKPASTGISKNNKASCLPAEVLLNILHCLDFNTLVAVYVTNHLFHIVIETNAAVLAKRREMRLYIQDDGVILYACDTRHELCIPAIPSSTYADTMRIVASHLGFHKLETLNISNDWRNLPMERLFSAAPAVRFVETLQLSIAAPDSASAKSPDDVNRFAAQFPRLRRLCFPLAYGPAYFDWCSFLRSEGALKLPELDAREMCGYAREDGSIEHPTEEEWLRYATDDTQIPEGVGKFVRLNLTYPRSFLIVACAPNCCVVPVEFLSHSVTSCERE